MYFLEMFEFRNVKDSSKEERVKAMSTGVAAANGWAKSSKVFNIF